MEEKVLGGLSGVSIYGIISICIFFAFFMGMLIWAFAFKKPYLKSMREMPLDLGEEPNSFSGAPVMPERGPVTRRGPESDHAFEPLAPTGPRSITSTPKTI